METTTSIRIQADADSIFKLAAEVHRWPRILPHYRSVRVLREEGNRRLLVMAARRDWIPVTWAAIQELHPAERRITFRHVRGLTRGMEVEWTLRPSPEGVRVEIWHRFNPVWLGVPDRAVELIVGRFFVHGIASRTLQRIKMLAERQASGTDGR